MVVTVFRSRLRPEAQRAWSAQVDHVAAKKRGRAEFYSEYSIQVCDVVRESRFPR